MTSRHTIATVAVLSLVGAATVLSQSPRYPVNWKGLPEPVATPVVRNNADVLPSRPEGAELRVPGGFTVQEYMTGFNVPRFMMLGPTNEILLSDSGSRNQSNGAVYVIKEGAKAKIIDGLERPYGLALADEWLFVGGSTSITRFTYDAKTMKVTTAGEEIVSLKDFGGGHWTRTLLVDRDRKKLYVTVGSGSNIDLGEDPMRAAVHRFNYDGTGHETVATGMRNTIGLRWHPGTRDLWAGVQERDGLGDDLVSDYVVKVQEGAFYGWPISYIGPHKEPRHKDVEMKKVESTQYPDVLLGAHVAVLDILFYTGRQFPEKYRGGMFLAFHGSWNRSQRTGYKIAFIPFKDGKPTSGPEDFLTGWMLDPAKKEVWGRPVGLVQQPDGSLLVTDDGGKKIWQVTYTGTTSAQR